MHRDSDSVCRLEVVNTGRRRRWSFEEKLRIVEESFRGDRQVSATARRYEISRSLLVRWRRSFGEGHLGLEADPAGLVRAVVTPDVSRPAPGPTMPGRMEIETKDGVRIVVGTDVDGEALSRVLDILARR